MVDISPDGIDPDSDRMFFSMVLPCASYALPAEQCPYRNILSRDLGDTPRSVGKCVWVRRAGQSAAAV